MQKKNNIYSAFCYELIKICGTSLVLRPLQVKAEVPNVIPRHTTPPAKAKGLINICKEGEKPQIIYYCHAKENTSQLFEL